MANSSSHGRRERGHNLFATVSSVDADNNRVLLDDGDALASTWWIWGIAHIYFEIGLRNRLSVADCWRWIHARNQRAARPITQGSGKAAR